MSLLEEVRERKRKIRISQDEARTAEAEIFRLQQTCKHEWKYKYTTIVSRSDYDMLHQWIMHRHCEKCDADSNEYLFKPPCPIHMQPMVYDKNLEHLRPQEGQRNRHVLTNQYKCSVPGCTKTTVWELEGGED